MLGSIVKLLEKCIINCRWVTTLIEGNIDMEFIYGCK